MQESLARAVRISFFILYCFFEIQLLFTDIFLSQIDCVGGNDKKNNAISAISFILFEYLAAIQNSIFELYNKSPFGNSSHEY